VFKVFSCRMSVRDFLLSKVVKDGSSGVTMESFGREPGETPVCLVNVFIAAGKEVCTLLSSI